MLSTWPFNKIERMLKQMLKLFAWALTSQNSRSCVEPINLLFTSLHFQNIPMEHNLAKAKHRELSWILISKVSDIEILSNILSQPLHARSEHLTYLCIVKLTITSNHSSYTSKRLFTFATFIYPTYCTERSESKPLENQISSVLLTM